MDELRNKIFISTQPEDSFPELEKQFLNTGATLVNIPMIEVCEAEISVSEQSIILNADSFDWLVFTSKNGIQYFLKKFEKIAGKTFEKMNSKIAVIGKKTGNEFIKNGITADYTSDSNLAEKFVVELKEKVIQKNSKVLLLLGNLAGDLLEKEMSALAVVSRINCYETCKPKVKNPEAFNRLFSNENEMIIFTSSSGFENFVSIAKEFNIDIKNLKVASIGKSTTKTMNSFGIEPVFTASQSNLEGIANDIKTLYKLKR